jgi:hypothetical protein
MGNINGINSTMVKVPLLYKCSSDTSVVAINDVGTKTILINNNLGEGKSVSDNHVDCANKLLSMTWEMVARDIARNLFGKDVNEAQAKELAQKLMAANKNYMGPAEVLKDAGMPFGEAVISTVLLKFKYSQYYSYERFLNPGDNKFGIKWGSFPRELPISISKEFKDALVNARAAAAPAKAATVKRTIPQANKHVQAPVQPPPKEQGCPPAGHPEYRIYNDATGQCTDENGNAYGDN